MTFEESQRLKAEAERLWAESYAKGHEGDLAMAGSETILAVLTSREMLTTAEADLVGARGTLAKAVAILDPVAAELEQVTTELATIDPENAGSLNDRLAARQRFYALQDEVEPLRQKVADRERAVAEAKELVRSIERDTIPMAQAELDRAVAALLNPPIDDFARLVEVAPNTVVSRGQRVGHLLLTPEQIRTPHARHILAALIPTFQMTGLWWKILDFWLSTLKGKVDPETYATVRQALKPWAEDLVEYRESFKPNLPVPARAIDPEALKRAAVDAQLESKPQVGMLPGYDCPQGEATRRADQTQQAYSYGGPADWPVAGQN